MDEVSNHGQGGAQANSLASNTLCDFIEDLKFSQIFDQKLSRKI